MFPSGGHPGVLDAPRLRGVTHEQHRRRSDSHRPLHFLFLPHRPFPIVKGYQQMGDAFWPRAVLFVLIGLSVILIVQSF